MSGEAACATGWFEAGYPEISASTDALKEEETRLPEDMDYTLIPGLRIEAREKLMEIRPISIGQAGRISGVSPADIAVLLIWLEQQK